VVLGGAGAGVPGPARPAASGQILVPLDGSPLAEGALGPAIALARAWDAELALLQVVRPVIPAADPTLPLPLPSAFDEDLTTTWRTQAQDYIDDIVEELHEQGIRATGAAALGWHAADSILETARPERVAAIVIATHGRGGLRRLALGSVADKVVRGADVPVLVYRPAGRGAAKKRSTPRTGSRGRRAAKGGKR
jgi:nucleotide-binding universal stress UspA family protein